MINVGIDIIEIDRVKKILDRNDFFLKRCFSELEIAQLKGKKSFYSSVSTHFCAKEAFSKCVGESISRINFFKEVSVLNDETNKPYILLHGKLNEKYKNLHFSVSVSHCVKYACATVVSEPSFYHKLHSFTHRI